MMDNSKKQQGRQREQAVRKRLAGKPDKPSRPSKDSPKSSKPDNKSGAAKRPSSGQSIRQNIASASRRVPQRTAKRTTAQRIKPAVRAANRQAKNVARPMPTPPARRSMERIKSSGSIGGASGLSEELRLQATRLESDFERLEKQSQLSSIYDAIGQFDSRLVEFPLTIDALRDRGYVHSGQLEDQLEKLDDKWDEVRPRVESALQEQVKRLDRELDGAELKVNRMTNSAGVQAADTAVNSLSRQLSAATSAVEGLFQGLENELDTIGYRLNSLQQMLSRYEESPEIQLYEAEGPLLAVEAVWQQNGEEGPAGFLFLTDQRLLFEQREEVVTKRKFGLFKSESEKIQKVLIGVQTHEIDQVSHKEEGGFLGMGKDDILELVFADTAALTRARFHLKGQESADWAAMIKRVKTGEIDADRAEDYLEEVVTAVARTASFPSQCPNCYAAAEPPPRGATSVTCGFCGTVITPQST